MVSLKPLHNPYVSFKRRLISLVDVPIGSSCPLKHLNRDFLSMVPSRVKYVTDERKTYKKHTKQHKGIKIQSGIHVFER